MAKSFLPRKPGLTQLLFPLQNHLWKISSFRTIKYAGRGGKEEEHPKLSNGPVVSESLPGSYPSRPLTGLMSRSHPKMSWLSLAHCSERSCSSGMESGLVLLIKSICCPQPLGCFKLLKVGPGLLGRGCLENEAANPIPEGSERFVQFMGLFSCQAWWPNFPSCH